MPPPPAPRWSLVVPVKLLAEAKTRLAAVAGAHRRDLALAFAVDTIGAAVASPRVAAVVVVTDDPTARPALAEVGAVVVSDAPRAGLNAALAHGASVAGRLLPGAGVGALAADLPALRPAELTRALDAAATHPVSFVADATGSGTTLLVAAPGASFAPMFGPDSRTRHSRVGFRELRLPDIASVRRDVDTEADLRDAQRIGVGSRTAAILAALPHTDVATMASLAHVQATVRSFAPELRSGTVLLDDGSALPYDARAFDAGGLRLLRPGQRVRIRVTGEGADRQVDYITLATFPDSEPAP